MGGADVIKFEWRVAEDGYSWEDMPPGKVLKLSDAAAFRSALRVTHPLKDNPALFLDFADLEASEDSILAFANRHGRLGYVRRQSEPAGDPRQREDPGESLSVWIEQIEAMRKTTSMWVALMQHDGDALRKAAQERLDQDGADRLYPEMSVAADYVERGWEYDRFHMWYTEGEATRGIDETADADPFLARFATFWIQSAINQRIIAYVPDGLWYSFSTLRLEFHVAPDSLLGAMWLQFGLAVSENRRYRRCMVCGKWFVVPPDAPRNTKQFCSVGCRVKAHRKKQQVSKAGEGDTE